MNWEVIGAVSEVVGAVGIIVTLAYLTVQVRQNSKHLVESSKLVEASQIEATASSGIEFRKMLLINPELLDIQNRGSQSFLTLDPLEQQKFDNLIRIMFLQSQTMYLRHLLFKSDPEDYAGPTRIVEDGFRNMPGFREWYDQANPDWRPEFRQWLESIVERIDREKASEETLTLISEPIRCVQNWVLDRSKIMTEYELIAATEAMAQTAIGLSDISASNIAIYLSLVFAYTTVAYVAGKNLSRVQVAIATFVYVASSLYIVGNIIGFSVATINVLERMAAVNPDKLSLLDGQRFSLWLDIIIWPMLMFVSLIFMWNIRHEKDG